MGVCSRLVFDFAVVVVLGCVGIWVLNSLGLACITGFWDCDFLGWDSFGARLLVLDLILDFDGVVPGLGSLLSGCWCLFWV